MPCWLCGFETTELSTNPRAPKCNKSPCQICIQVTNVDEEIDQAVATLQRLLAKRCDLRSEQNRIHGSLVHQFPVELSSRIFEQLQPVRDKWGKIGGVEWKNETTRFTSVCRRWRDIAWSTPALWSTIHISPGTRIDLSSLIKSTQEWILRSRTLPLTLYIVVHDEKGAEVQLKAIVDAITQSSNRWQFLCLDIPTRMLQAFHNFQCHSLMGLKINGRYGFRADPSTILNLMASPETINIRGISPRSLQVSWNHLSSASVEDFRWVEVMELFQVASQMTRCSLAAPIDTDIATLITPPIIHQRLKILCLRFIEVPDVAALLLGSLTLPCLEEFQTTDAFFLTPTYLPALIDRSSCPLTTIGLVLFWRDEYDLSALQPLPGVTDLVLDTVKENADLIKRLLLEEYLPDLCHLTIDIGTFVHLWDADIISMWLDTRKRLRSRLGKLLVTCQSDYIWDSKEREALKALKFTRSEDGFELLW